MRTSVIYLRQICQLAHFVLIILILISQLLHTHTHTHIGHVLVDLKTDVLSNIILITDDMSKHNLGADHRHPIFRFWYDNGNQFKKRYIFLKHE